jgi:hypothetical protein
VCSACCICSVLYSCLHSFGFASQKLNDLVVICVVHLSLNVYFAKLKHLCQNVVSLM